MNRDKAQHRIEAIAGFQEEFGRLQGMGLVALAPKERRAIKAYHDEVLADLGAHYELDAPAGPPAWGMRIAAVTGALVVAGLLAAALDAVWPSMALWARIAVALAAPLLLLALTEALRATGRRRYVVGLAAALAVTAFAGGLQAMAATMAMPLGLPAWLAIGLFAAALGQRYNLPVLAAAGLTLAGGVLAGLVATADGAAAAALFDRAEPLLAAGLALYLAAAVMWTLPCPVRPAYRSAGLALMAAALILLSHPGNSLLAAFAGVPPASMAAIYQFSAVIAGFAVMSAGLKFGWRDSLYGGLGFLIVFVLTRLDAWFGEALPDAVDILALIAAAALFAWLARLVYGLETARQER